MAKKYVSKIKKGNVDIYMKDLEAQAAMLIPVDVDSLTPSSTFVKNNVIALNGMFYRATADTSNFPVTLAVQDGAFVVNIVNGRKCFIVTDSTLKSGWEVWTDASFDYWVEYYAQQLDTKQATVSDLDTIRSGATAGATAYQKPNDGIPKTDMATAVQASLGLADTSLQSSQKGAAGGLAELDANGKVVSSQLPSYVDDVVNGYYYNGKFYKEAAHTTEITGEEGKIYIDLETNKTYRWNGSNAYVVISETLALGETSSTAYRGDRGKTAYDHSQAAHAPSDANKSSISYDTTNKKITQTIGTSTTDVVTASKLVDDGGGIKSHQTVTDNNPTLAWSAKSKVATIGSTEINVTMPANPNTDTTYKFTIGSTTKGDSTNGVDLGTLKSETAAASGTTLSLVTTGEKATWNGKGTYSKPSGGIPKTDLADAVQTSLGKADSALQSHQSVTDNNPTLSWGAKSKVATIGGTEINVTMPANPNTNTTYSFAEGSTNGAFSVTPSGGSAQSVPVHGLGTAAYKGVANAINTGDNLTPSSVVKAYVDDRAIIPVDENSLTPISTFVKGNVVGINGVFYYCTADTSHFPVVLAVQGNNFLYNEAGGHKCFIVTDATLQTGWIQWADASVEYWLSFKQDKLTFDTTPTVSSTNPVTSGGIKTALDAKQNTLTFDTTPTADSENPVTSGGIKTALDAKQDTLTFDTEPTQNSTKPVMSGGVYTALAGKQATLTFDSTPTRNSNNPVRSYAIFNALKSTIWRSNYGSETSFSVPIGTLYRSTAQYETTFNVSMSCSIDDIARFAFMVNTYDGTKINITVTLSHTGGTTVKTMQLTHPSGTPDGMYYFEVLNVFGIPRLVESYKKFTDFT